MNADLMPTTIDRRGEVLAVRGGEPTSSEGTIIWCSKCQVFYRPENASEHGHSK